MKIVVTGSSGYIGLALVEALLTDPQYEVVGIDRVVPTRPKQARFEFVPCDLSAPGAALQAPVFEGTQAVVHLAAARGDWAISKEEYWRDNVAATQGLLASPWARGVPRWVFMSSVSVYGPADVALAEGAPLRPIGPYGESKLASERHFQAFVAAQGVRGRVIRPSAVFSPGHPANTNVYKLIESLRSFPLPLIGGGHNRKTLTYLPNLLQLIFWCLREMNEDVSAYEVFNYVEEPVQTVLELISALKAAGILPARRIAVPLSFAVAASYPVYALAKLARVDLRVTPERVRKYAASTWYDASRVRRAGFVPKVDLDEALRRTAAWHLSR
jgi:nucleoside-diphosphate-sugar epimerase